MSIAEQGRESAQAATPHAPRERRIERIVRKVALGGEPSLVDEYAHLTNAERAALFLALRRRVIEERHGPDRRFERVCEVARRP